MIVILSIVFLIAGISLYDYFTARKWQQVTSAARNEIVFENRNRKYGAYVLRRDYDKNMVCIMAGLIALFGIGFGTFVYARSMPEKVIELPKSDITTTIDTYKEEELPPEPPEPEKVEVPLEKTTAFIEPKVSDDQFVDDLPVDGEMDDKKIDTKNQDGEDIVWGNPIDDDDEKKKIVDIKADVPLEFVDEEAAFKGFREYIVENVVYPQVPLEMGIGGTCYVRFVVNTDGTVSNVSISRGLSDCPECEQEAMRVIRKMRGWKPAKHNGKEVRSWLQVPINFSVQ